jgi:hypothetical protein
VLPVLSQGCRGSRKKLSEAARHLARGHLRFDDERAASPEVEIDRALALLGLYVEGGISLDSDEFWLWPENEQAFLFWLSIQTQWQVGMAGPTGLNYQGVEICMRRRPVPPRERNQLFEQVQAMERAALDEWANMKS